MPPGRTKWAAARIKNFWSSTSLLIASGLKRHLASARRASTPVLLHGTSARTKSKPPLSSEPTVSDRIGSTIVMPIRRQLLAMRSIFSAETSEAIMLPRLPIISARWVVFVPGAAQRSSTFMPGFGAAARTTPVAVGSCGWIAPRRNASRPVTSRVSSSTIDAPFAWALAATPAAASSSSKASTPVTVWLTRQISGARTLACAATSTAFSNEPSMSIHLSASSGGREYAPAR